MARDEKQQPLAYKITPKGLMSHGEGILLFVVAGTLSISVQQFAHNQIENGLRASLETKALQDQIKRSAQP